MAQNSAGGSTGPSPPAMDADHRRQLRESSERDLMNWGRTALTLLSTGIGFERALAVVAANNSHLVVDPFDVLRILALSLMGLGLIVLGLAARTHVRALAHLRRGLVPTSPGYSISLILAGGILAIFTTALVTVLTFRDVVRPNRSSIDSDGRTVIVHDRRSMPIETVAQSPTHTEASPRVGDPVPA